MPRKIQLSEAPPRLPVRIQSVESLGDEVYCIRMDSPGRSWQPGDCIAVYAPEGSGISRPYSLSGAVQETGLELWVRRFAGGAVSDFLCGCREGDVIEISPPFGWFRPGEPAIADKLYFATGTGIAPFRSAIRSRFSAPRACFWGLRKPLVYQPEFPIRTFLSQSTQADTESGRFSQILDQISFTKATHVYACGLDSMIEEVLSYFSAQGLPETQMHRECFFTANQR